ncbi:MAG: CRISPR-associated protein Cas2 [Clostridiales bacterium]|nr:CRISPR-associated protein Cas2 [Clostridiales bacterium]MDN5281603.1 CRISPR-associated protein Cas2 [Candidatus Ozemobacter sp.]
MRVMVFFDLPVKKKSERKKYTVFRRFLLNDGFTMMQYSVYSRLCNSYENAEMHCKRVKANIPPKGSVRALIITEKQFAGMKFLVGKKSFSEKNESSQGVFVF